jgi:hypothetical protein
MDELSQAMISTYLGALVENDAEIADSDMLSHLFFGDGDQISYISSTLEWMSQADDADNSLEELDLELDLDDLLVVDSTDEHEFTSSPANPEFTESDFTEEDLVEPSRLAHRKRVRPRLDQGSGDDAPDDEAIEE